MKNKITLLMAVLISSMLLTACNTTKGIGKDIEAGGKTIQDSADKNSH